MTSNSRKDKRQNVEISGMAYDTHGAPITACTVRNVSSSGAQVEMTKEIELPATFQLALSRDGTVRRRCHKMWQFATVAGVRFASQD
jgi:hypothetical protein